jgi:hypothetical protein
LLNQEAVEVTSFDSSKNRTGSMRCQTSLFAYQPEPALSRSNKRRRLKRRSRFGASEAFFISEQH